MIQVVTSNAAPIVCSSLAEAMDKLLEQKMCFSPSVLVDGVSVVALEYTHAMGQESVPVEYTARNRQVMIELKLAMARQKIGRSITAATTQHKLDLKEEASFMEFSLLVNQKRRDAAVEYRRN